MARRRRRREEQSYLGSADGQLETPFDGVSMVPVGALHSAAPSDDDGFGAAPPEPEPVVDVQEAIAAARPAAEVAAEQRAVARGRSRASPAITRAGINLNLDTQDAVAAARPAAEVAAGPRKPPLRARPQVVQQAFAPPPPPETIARVAQTFPAPPPPPPPPTEGPRETNGIPRFDAFWFTPIAHLNHIQGIAEAWGLLGVICELVVQTRSLTIRADTLLRLFPVRAANQALKMLTIKGVIMYDGVNVRLVQVPARKVA